MNKVEVGLFVAVVGIMLSIGILFYYEMTNEIANNPDIKEFGPPVMTNLGPMVATVIVLAIAITIILKLGPKDDKKQP